MVLRGLGIVPFCNCYCVGCDTSAFLWNWCQHSTRSNNFHESRHLKVRLHWSTLVSYARIVLSYRTTVVGTATLRVKLRYGVYRRNVAPYRITVAFLRRKTSRGAVIRSDHWFTGFWPSHQRIFWHLSHSVAIYLRLWGSYRKNAVRKNTVALLGFHLRGIYGRFLYRNILFSM